jgi:hypothetical protein
MTPAQRQRVHRARIDAAGLRQVTIIVPASMVRAVRDEAARLVADYEAQALDGQFGDDIREAVLARHVRGR